MKVLVWTVSDVHYAIAASRTAEVIPLVNVRPVAQSAAAMRGLINYRGHLIELIDMGVLFGGHPIDDRMACRIVVVDVGDTEIASPTAGEPAETTTSNVADDPSDEAERAGTQPTSITPRQNGPGGRLVGVLVETLVGLTDLDFTEPPPADALDCLGPISVTDSTTIQLIWVKRLHKR